MEKTFKDKAVSGAVKFSKKSVLLKPFVFSGLFIVLFFYAVFNYFGQNAKKYITIAFAIVFFAMSSSFATVSQAYEQDVFLQTKEVEEVSKPVEETVTIDIKDVLSDIEFIDDDDDANISTEDIARELDVEDEFEVFSIEELFGTGIGDGNVETGDTSVFDKNAWYLILVNKTNPIPDDYEVKLTTLSGRMKCDERVKDILSSMLSAARKDGVGLMVSSPYRDYKLQTKLFNKKVNTYMDKGYSYLDAYKLASKKVIIPGASEHQLGIAFDIVSNDHRTLDSAFGTTKAGLWLKEHCAEFGFILRYPKGKEDITGIVYEPWHFRYVGVEAATYIMEHDITLEEFIEGLE